MSVGDVIIQAKALGKQYRLYPSGPARLRAALGLEAPYESHWALRDVSFEVRRGQCIGLIGDNGAGKSTLLKLLAGTLAPSHGHLLRLGRVTAILELGAGFHPEFTGRENLTFAAGLVDIPPELYRQIESSVIDFAELNDAIDRPVKTYSSGMVVRLAFALVTAVMPDLLIIDEALAVGDQHFQKKCIDRIDAFRRSGCTILLCSHSLYHIRQLCDRVLWLHQGQKEAWGDTETVLAAYEAHVRRRQDAVDSLLEAKPARPIRDGLAASIESVRIMGLPPIVGSTMPVLPGPDLRIEVIARSSATRPPSIGLMIEQVNGVGITTMGTHVTGQPPRPLGDDAWVTTLVVPDLPLHSGQYSVSAYLFDDAGLLEYDRWPDACQFAWVRQTGGPGLVELPHRWE